MLWSTNLTIEDKGSWILSHQLRQCYLQRTWWSALLTDLSTQISSLHSRVLVLWTGGEPPACLQYEEKISHYLRDIWLSKRYLTIWEISDNLRDIWLSDRTCMYVDWHLATDRTVNTARRVLLTILILRTFHFYTYQYQYQTSDLGICVCGEGEK